MALHIIHNPYIVFGAKDTLNIGIMDFMDIMPIGMAEIMDIGIMDIMGLTGITGIMDIGIMDISIMRDTFIMEGIIMGITGDMAIGATMEATIMAVIITVAITVAIINNASFGQACLVGKGCGNGSFFCL
jgi:hypothetical protein